MNYSQFKQEIQTWFGKAGLWEPIVRGESVSLKGLYGSLESMFLESLAEKRPGPVFAVFSDKEKAEWVAEEMAGFLSESACAFFPSLSGEITDAAFHTRETGEQMEVVRDLSAKKLKLVVTDSLGLLVPLPDPDHLEKSKLTLQKDKEFDLYELVETLVGFGYNREVMVERPGEISLRGGILDVFPFTGEKPHRIEFFGNQIESMRMFDVVSQRSLSEASQLTLLPVPSAWNQKKANILSYLEKSSVIYLEDPDLIFASIEQKIQQIDESPFQTDSIRNQLSSRQTLSHYTISWPADVIDLDGKPAPKPGRGVSEIKKALISKDNQQTFLFCEKKEQAERIVDFLDIDSDSGRNLFVGESPVRRGFRIPARGITVFSDKDLFRKEIKARRRIRFAQGAPIREMSELKREDYVVHVDYGIGQYQGLQKIKVRDIERECLLVTYQDGDKLFVPVEKMERIQKWSAKEGAVPSLTKLGTNKWDKIKEKTKQAIKDIAGDLIKIYSARQAFPGFAFSEDTSWEKELEASFPYDETDDQQKAIDQVKEDMMSDRPMDRLVCGDVGYGKTEVAIRAAFKAVCSGKQVGILVPTTILAAQHTKTFRERLRSFPVNVEELSRFRSKKEQDSVIVNLRLGKVDIVIGTHRLLSGDVQFKDLGLLIIDEEQRFGVKHKEKLKMFRETVDVLALSATPIPRTLQLSLVGIRDMSLMTTPPKDRLPIQTEVMPFNEHVVAEAIEEELNRNGQIFFVHNRVQSIHAMARMLQRIVPGLRFGIAHGQMASHQLEEVMMDFTVGKIDCLVSTMIIESGLDMPHVNTLLVNRADRMGLAQLYQLRGRVGRSNQKAYAYLFTPPFDLLSKDAIKRLRTIEEFTELGSGFQIALRDLEIRGAGNLLGVKQSGNMEAVGFDLYNQLVQEAVEEIREEQAGLPAAETVRETDCQVDYSEPAFFPESYISDENLRVNMYKKLAGIKHIEELAQFREELKDRFGIIPEEAGTLLEISHLRILGQAGGFKHVRVETRSMQAIFDETFVERFPSQEHFSQHLRSIINSTESKLRFIEKRGFGFRTELRGESALEAAKKLLQTWG